MKSKQKSFFDFGTKRKADELDDDSQTHSQTHSQTQSDFKNLKKTSNVSYTDDFIPQIPEIIRNHQIPNGYQELLTYLHFIPHERMKFEQGYRTLLTRMSAEENDELRKLEIQEFERQLTIQLQIFDQYTQEIQTALHKHPEFIREQRLKYFNKFGRFIKKILKIN